jgi:hypothetical protein
VNIPSLADYATHEDAIYPELWSDCVFACCPSLGVTGSRLYDLVSGYYSAAANYVASQWIFDRGYYGFDFPSPTNNRSITWLDLSLDLNCVAFSIWVRHLGQASNNCILSIGTSGTAFRIFANSDGTYSANISSGSAVLTSSVIPTSEWVHIVAQRNRSRGNLNELWINGSLAASGTQNIGFANLSPILNIGARRDSSGPTNIFVGQFDDARINQRLFSRDEIKVLSSQRAIAYVGR